MNGYKHMRSVFSPAYTNCLQYCTRSSKNIEKVGYVLGTFESNDKNELTDAARIVDQQSAGNLSTFLNYGGPLKAGKSRVLYGVSESYPVISMVGLGEKDVKENILEECDLKKELVRNAVAAGVRSLSDNLLTHLKVDSCYDSEASAESAHLAQFTYDDLKAEKKNKPKIECIDNNEGWERGSILAEGQNIARRLMAMPANYLTPTNFATEAVSTLEKVGVEVHVRTAEWAKERKMGSFLSVSKGSAEPPIFLELNYKGAQNSSDAPLAIVGKGVTFDAGGISIKPSKNMDKMRADMGGAACTVGSIYSAAALGLKHNIRGFIPLCENLPSGTANKPGDVVTASNGLTIEIDNTDAEGRLILADALHHASQYNPKAMIDMATLTGAMVAALGAGCTGAFTNSIPLWELIHKAGMHTGDRMWRMPMFNMYEKQVKDFGNADVHNLGKHSGAAGSALAAVFLKQFVTCDHWIHLDIAGVMENSDEVPYLGSGMSGRPTRTIVKLIEMMANGEFKP